MINPLEDGTTHINIYSRGKTELGKYLSNFTLQTIQIEGEAFNSIEAYWYYLLTGDKVIRDMWGYNAKKRGKELLKTVKPLRDKNSRKFKNLIKKALDIKLKSHPYYLKLLQDSTLPFEHYYYYGKGDNTKVIDAGYKWIIEHIEQRRELLHKHTPIDLSKSY